MVTTPSTQQVLTAKSRVSSEGAGWIREPAKVESPAQEVLFNNKIDGTTRQIASLHQIRKPSHTQEPLRTVQASAFKMRVICSIMQNHAPYFALCATTMSIDQKQFEDVQPYQYEVWFLQYQVRVTSHHCVLDPPKTTFPVDPVPENLRPYSTVVKSPQMTLRHSVGPYDFLVRVC